MKLFVKAFVVFALVGMFAVACSKNEEPPVVNEDQTTSVISDGVPDTAISDSSATE
jgi:hypothetical protein